MVQGVAGAEWADWADWVATEEVGWVVTLEVDLGAEGS